MVAGVGLGLVIAGGVRAQQAAAPSTGAAAAATTPKRFEMVVPPGWERVSVAGRTAVCRPADAAWVRQALGEVKATTRPTTMPADLVKRVTDNRTAVTRAIVADFALADDREVGRLFDELLIPTLTKMQELRPPIIFLVCTQPQLRELVASGWGEPKLRYNRVAQEVSYDDRVSLAIDRPMDDTVLPARYAESDPPEVRAKRLTAEVQQLEANVTARVAAEGLPAIYNRVGQFLDEQFLEPLKLRRDQLWLAMGVNGFFTGKYGEMLTGHPRDAWLRSLTYEDRRQPVGARSIDLTRPADEATMRPGAAPYYTQAMRRKAVAVVAKWVEKTGEPSVTKVLVALRKGVPADGAGLVKLIQDVAGVDVSKDVAAQ
jgi:hypothetical protein